MKAKDKTQAFAAFVERLKTTFNSIDGRKAENLLIRLDREINREEAWKQGRSGVALLDALVESKSLTPQSVREQYTQIIRDGILKGVANRQTDTDSIDAKATLTAASLKFLQKSKAFNQEILNDNPMPKTFGELVAPLDSWVVNKKI